MRRVLIVAAVGLASLAAMPARASLWGTAGGDSGRSGLQPRGGGTAPYQELWSAIGPNSQDVVTSVIVTSPGAQGQTPRVVYGTDDGRLHLRDLYTGEAIGGREGTLVGKLQPKVSMTGFGGSVTPVDSSTDDGLGQLFAVVNDRPAAVAGADGGSPAPQPGIAIAQVDEQTGNLVQLVRVPGTEGMTTSSSPVLADLAPDGSRSLLFTAIDRSGWERPAPNGPRGRLFRVPLRDPRAVRTIIDTDAMQASEVPDLNPLAAPVLLGVRDTSARPQGPLTTYVTIAGRDPDQPLRTMDANDFGDAQGGVQGGVQVIDPPRRAPASGRLDPRASAESFVFAQAPAVPRTAGGAATALLLATYAVEADETVVQRLVPNTAGTAFVVTARSRAFAGRPGPQLAASEGGADAVGTVVVGTSHNLYGLQGDDLSLRWTLERGAGVPEGRGFARTAPVLSAGVAFVTRDNGQRLALAFRDGVVLGEDQFDATVAATTTGSAVGAPAATPVGVIVTASDKGVVALRNRCGNVLDPRRDGSFVGTLAGDRAVGSDAPDRAFGLPGDDCLDGAAGDDLLQGGFGEDTLVGGLGDDELGGGDDNDTLTGNGGADHLRGDRGADTLDGGFDADVLKGGPGVDMLIGGDGADRLYGDGGIDTLLGGNGKDRLSGGSGDDRLEGGRGVDTLIGGPGRDVLLAGTGRGTLSGGPGDDRLDAANGARNVVDCGSGRDRARADRADLVRGCENVRRMRVRGIAR